MLKVEGNWFFREGEVLCGVGAALAGVPGSGLAGSPRSIRRALALAEDMSVSTAAGKTGEVDEAPPTTLLVDVEGLEEAPEGVAKSSVRVVCLPPGFLRGGSSVRQGMCEAATRWAYKRWWGACRDCAVAKLVGLQRRERCTMHLAPQRLGIAAPRVCRVHHSELKGRHPRGRRRPGHPRATSPSSSPGPTRTRGPPGRHLFWPDLDDG